MMRVNRIRKLHEEAMHLVDIALPLIACNYSRRLYRNASLLEAEAAASIELDELTRGVLYRSAASMSLCGGDYKQAILLANTGLDGTPPPEIVEELNEVRECAEKRMRGDEDG